MSIVLTQLKEDLYHMVIRIMHRFKWIIYIIIIIKFIIRTITIYLNYNFNRLTLRH